MRSLFYPSSSEPCVIMSHYAALRSFLMNEFLRGRSCCRILCRLHFWVLALNWFRMFLQHTSIPAEAQHGVCIDFCDRAYTGEICPFISTMHSPACDTIPAHGWDPSTQKHPAIAGRPAPFYSWSYTSDRFPQPEQASAQFQSAAVVSAAGTNSTSSSWYVVIANRASCSLMSILTSSAVIPGSKRTSP